MFEKILKFWFPVIFYSAIIFYISSLTGDSVDNEIGNFDKILHVVLYLPFGFLLARALKRQNYNLAPLVIWMLVVLGTFLYGLSDEFHQSFVAGRDSSGWDLIADIIGGSIGGYLYPYFHKVT